MNLSASIIICTNGRAEALANGLNRLGNLGRSDIEVCIVAGPNEDGTADVLREWEGRIRIARNSEFNISASRNIGITMATADIVAFIDDDALPAPEWLPQILEALDDPHVGGIGGIVINHESGNLEARYSSMNRLGHVEAVREMPAYEFNFPYSYNFPYLHCTNCVFRRDALLSIGGFDEEFDYCLDVADACCRLVDAGWRIWQLPDAVVRHGGLPDPLRTGGPYYASLKNKLYFSLVNNRGHYSERRAIEDMLAFVEKNRRTLCENIASRTLSGGWLELYDKDVDRAWAVGLRRGLSGLRRFRRTDG